MPTNLEEEIGVGCFSSSRPDFWFDNVEYFEWIPNVNQLSLQGSDGDSRALSCLQGREQD